jgi:Raf kinase inhibitor-like YbhB/YbcL family protein
VPQALQDTPYAKLPQVPAFKVTSTDVATGEEMAKTYRSDTGGGNTSPELSWSGFPEGTKSFVVSMYDQDAPTGSGFWHWEVYNLPASTTSLPTGAGAVKSTTLPSGAVQGTNDAGIAGYLGAAPPAGQKHRYFITVSALNVAKLDLPATASPAFVNFNIFGHTIGRGTLVPLAATPAG